MSVLRTPPPSSACTCPNTLEHYALSFRFSRSCSTNLPLLQKPTLGTTILHTLTKFSHHQHKEVGTSSSISHSTQPLPLSLPSAPSCFLISWPPSPVLLHGSSTTTLTSLSSALFISSRRHKLRPYGRRRTPHQILSRNAERHR